MTSQVTTNYQPSFPENMHSTSKFNFDEYAWVVRISRNLDEELEEEIEVPVSVFTVPKTLLMIHPISFVPQQVAIGPYHYFRPEHYEMERYKIAAAKRIQKEHKTLKFHHVVDQFKKYDQRIRAHYHNYLNHNGETLAWMMAVDASFLLEFLSIFAQREGKVLTRISSRVSHLIDIAGKKSAHNIILRDIVMLENQMPLFLLRKVLEFRLSSLDLADELLISMLTGFYEEISPLKAVEGLPNIEVMTKSAHLLDFLYHTIVLKSEGPSGTTEIDEEQGEVKEGEEKSFEKSSYVHKIHDIVWNALSKCDRVPVCIMIKKIFRSKPIEVMLKLPWKIISSFPGIRLLKQPLENLFFPLNKEDAKGENKNSKAGGNFEKPPLVEEIDIPSVTELSKTGVRFVPTQAGISSIKFDVKTSTFYLPVVCLDVNTEVVLRNLVAYEACYGSGPLVFARYTELMNGIVDTEEDAKILREKGIIVNRLKKDADVATLWNGMSKSIRLTKVDFLDKTIGDVNKYYDGRFKVKFKKFVTSYVFGSWKFLTLLAAILMLLLMAVEAFCSVYSCPRIFNHVKNFQ